MRKQKLSILAECAIMVALSAVLSMIRVFQAPYGGSVTLFSMVPLILLSLRHGTGWGLGAGFVTGCINLLAGLSDLSYLPTPAGIVACIFLDYLVAFTLVGTAGLFRNWKPSGKESTDSVLAAGIGTTFALLLRFACHVISGAVIWYELTKGWNAGDPAHIVNRFGPWIYSLLYNGAFMLPEYLMTLVAVPLVSRLLGILRKTDRGA